MQQDNTQEYVANYQDEKKNQYQFALVVLTSLFFMWGFITCLNDILIPYLKAAFSLSYTEAMLIQFCFFGAYFVMSVPAGMLVKRIGFQKGIVAGLSIASVGCVLFYPAASLEMYSIFLGALFVLASGITLLQVAANPYVTVLGHPDSASSRLTLTQAFNSLGTTVAPFFGAWLLFSTHDAPMTSEGVKLPYLMLAGALALLAVIFSRLSLPNMQEKKASSAASMPFSVWEHRQLLLGAVGIFLYVGAEVAIGSFLVNFLAQPDIAGLDEASASRLIAYYWSGAMVGRFIGAWVMRYISAGTVLAFNATMAIVLLVVGISSTGSVAMWSILAIGLFNSIMFPTIFSMALRDLGEHTSQGSGVLCLAIVGGAIVPVFQGMLADAYGLQPAFVLPIFCYLFIAYFGISGRKPLIAKADEPGAAHA